MEPRTNCPQLDALHENLKTCPDVNQTRGKSQDPRCNPTAQETSYQAGNSIADAISFCVYSLKVFNEKETLMKKKKRSS